LFVLFSFYVLHPEGVCGLLQKKPAAAPAYKPQQKKSAAPAYKPQQKKSAAPAYKPQQKKSPAPSVRCAQFSGYGSPLQINERSKKTKKKKKLGGDGYRPGIFSFHARQ
jgi:hypothetical protein